MQAPVFISHSSKDQKVAGTICPALESRGLDCWISGRDIAPGQNFMEAIVPAIRYAKVMVLVFSENANNSDDVKREVVLASQNKVVVIPVRVEDIVPNDAFTNQFATRQWIDLFDDWERQIERLIVSINKVVSDRRPVETRGVSSSVQPAMSPSAAPGQKPLLHNPSERTPIVALQPNTPQPKAQNAPQKAIADGSPERGTKLAAICVWIVSGVLVVISFTVFGPSITETQSCIRAGGSGVGCGGPHFPAQLLWLAGVLGAGYGVKLWARKVK